MMPCSHIRRLEWRVLPPAEKRTAGHPWRVCWPAGCICRILPRWAGLRMRETILLPSSSARKTAQNPIPQSIWRWASITVARPSARELRAMPGLQGGLWNTLRSDRTAAPALLGQRWSEASDFFIYQAGFAQGGSGLGTVHTEAADPLVPEKLGQGQCPSAIAVSREVAA